MAVAYHTHVFEIPTATDEETEAGVISDKVVVPSGLAAALEDFQPLAAPLQSIAGLTTAADEMLYLTAADTYATTALYTLGRSLLGESSAAGMRTVLELGSMALEDTSSYTPNSGLATVATTGAYSDLSGLPTLGTAAAADTGDFATAAQGSTADTALQPGDIGTTVQGHDAFLDALGAMTTGTEGQVIAFDASGDPVAVNAGAGDMLAATYDPDGKAANVFDPANLDLMLLDEVEL